MTCFEALLSLKINLEKSELIPIGSIADVEALAQELGRRVGDSTYLGLPLGACYKSMHAWDEVEEHFKKRLTMWKR